MPSEGFSKICRNQISSYAATAIANFKNVMGEFKDRQGTVAIVDE